MSPYRQAAAEERPDVIRVADRWHLMDKARKACLDAERRWMAANCSLSGWTTKPGRLHTGSIEGVIAKRANRPWVSNLEAIQAVST
ncbi:MAG: hypothetical protein AB7O80_13990 [Acetobacteraceae bacterium]